MTSLEHPRSRPVAEHEPPADLLEALARELAPYDFGPRETISDRHEPPRALLTALAEWADGALIDPSTWTRVTATPQPMALGLFAAFMADDDEDWPDEPIYTLTREDDHADPT